MKGFFVILFFEYSCAKELILISNGSDSVFDGCIRQNVEFRWAVGDWHAGSSIGPSRWDS